MSLTRKVGHILGGVMNSATADSVQASLAESSEGAPAATTIVASKRNVAVDAYRGLVMLLMMGEVMQWAAVSHAYPQSVFWRILAFNQTHVEWEIGRASCRERV